MIPAGRTSPHLDALLGTLAVDATTAEVMRMLEEDGCAPVLLRGPALFLALYGEGDERHYCDTDVLVSPHDLDRAGARLAALGFRLVLDHHDHPGVSEPHAQEWRRSSRESVDLHWRVAGVRAGADRAWEILSARTQPIAIGGATVRTLDRAGIALIVALHAAHHGTTAKKPLVDLDRALSRLDAATWREAAQLADELDAAEAFAAGLRLSRAGAALADRLGLPGQVSARRRLMASSQPAGSLGLLRVIEARGRRLLVIRQTLFPAPDYMRATYRAARRGWAGLLGAYAARLLGRAVQIPAAIRALRAARRDGGTVRS